MMEITRELLLKMYATMFLIRLFEEKAIELSGTGVFPGKLHSSLGQEAMAAGACLALRADDCIVSTHRPVGHLLAKGADPGRLFAEFMGKTSGYSGGKGGMMHVADPELGILGSQGIVGGGIPIAAGAGLALKLQKKDKVILCFFGDGASNTGAFHEGINLAALWKLPVVFFCENNIYAVSTRISESSAIGRVSPRAAAYGIPGPTMDGNDVLAVFEATSSAVERARAGLGPSLIEAVSYRLRGHYEGDPLNYRSQAEVDLAFQAEPIRRFRKELLARPAGTEAELAALEARAAAQVDAAVRFGMASPPADVRTISENVYA